MAGYLPAPADSDGGRTASSLGNVGRRGRVFFWVGFWRVPELHEPSHVAHQIESATAAETIARLSAVIPQFLFGNHLAQGGGVQEPAQFNRAKALGSIIFRPSAAQATRRSEPG